MPTLFNRSHRSSAAPKSKNKEKGKTKDTSNSSNFGFRRSSAPTHPTKSSKKYRLASSTKAGLVQQEETTSHIFCSPTTSDGFVHLLVSLLPSSSSTQIAPPSSFRPPPALSSLRGALRATNNPHGQDGRIPTLASAIHLDGSHSSATLGGAPPMFPSSTFGPSSLPRNVRPMISTSSRIPSPLDLPPSTSITSDHTVHSSNSGHSISIIPSERRPSSRASRASRTSRMSLGGGIKGLGLGRKLSIDGLLHHVVRKRSSQAIDLPANGGRKLDIRRWSSTALPPSAHGARTVNAPPEVVRENHRHSLALPSIRTLRNKFSTRSSILSPEPARLPLPQTQAPRGAGQVKSNIGIGFPPLSRLSPRLISVSKRHRVSLGDIHSPTPAMGGPKFPVGMVGILHRLEAEEVKQGNENVERRSPLSMSMSGRANVVPDRRSSLGAPSSVPTTHHFVPRLIPFDSPPEDAISVSTSLAAHSRTPNLTPHLGHLAANPTPVNARFVSPARDDTSPLDPCRSPLPAVDSTMLAPSETTRYPMTASNSTLTTSSAASGPDGRSRQSLAELRVAVRQMRDLQREDSSSDLARTASHASTLAKLVSSSGGCRQQIAKGDDSPLDPAATSITGAAGGRHSIDGLPFTRSARRTTPASHALKPSRSKITTALPALLSAFDLVETTQRTQGHGWWSRLPPPPPHPSHITPGHGRAMDESRVALEEKLVALEKLVQSASIRPRNYAMGTPASGSVRSVMTPPPPRRPITPRSERTPWRPGSGLPRSRSRSYVAPIPHPIFDSPRKSHLRSSFSITPETPCRASKVHSRPNPPRRVSWLVEDQPPSPRTMRPGTPKSRLVSPRHVESPLERSNVLQDKVNELRAKHALETDALLSALSGAKVGEDRLRKEVEGLHRLLAEGLAERELLRGRVSKLEHWLERGEPEERSESARRGVHRKNRASGLAIKGADELLGPGIDASETGA